MNTTLNVLLASMGDVDKEARALRQCVTWANITIDVRIATTAREVMDTVADGGIDIVLMDHHLPSTSGRKFQGKEVICEVRHEHGGTLPATFCMFSSDETQNYYGRFSGAEFEIDRGRFLAEMTTQGPYEEADKLAAILTLVALRRK